MRQRLNILDLGLVTCLLPYCCTCVDHLVFWSPSYTKQADPQLLSPGFENPYIFAPLTIQESYFWCKCYIYQVLHKSSSPQICDDDDVGTRSILNERSSHVLVYCSFCLTKKGPTTNPLSQHMRHIFTYGEFFLKILEALILQGVRKMGGGIGVIAAW